MELQSDSPRLSRKSFQVEPSTSSFVSVIHGDLPLILSAPHGGTEQPDWFPNLTARRHMRDAHTLELAQQIAEYISLHFQRNPFVLLNRLHRKKMDANREVNTATEGAVLASLVYDSYHEALKMCCEAARAFSASGEALLLDIHGYAPLPDVACLNTSWIMVGHLIPARVLRENSLLKNEEWIRGSSSMGSLLEKHGLMAEPSARQRAPSQVKYFEGGYITTAYRREGAIRTVQLEFPRPMRDNLDHVAPKVANATMELLFTWKMIANRNI